MQSNPVQSAAAQPSSPQPPPADLTSAFTAADQTTMHGDLPAGFWDEDDQPAPEAGPPPGPTPATTAPQERSAHEQADGEEGEDGAVPLFAPADGQGALPRPRSGSTDGAHAATASRHAASPGFASEPEGERYAQLRALFPGRIIEVSRPRPPATPMAAEGEQHDAPGGTGYPAVDGYVADLTDAATDEQDEPRYDTAAEAAAEE